MAMLWLQGFDQYYDSFVTVNADVSTLAALVGFTEFAGYTSDNSPSIGVNSTFFRVAGKSIRMKNNAANAGHKGISVLRKAFTNPDNLLVFGFAIRGEQASIASVPIAYLGGEHGAGYRNHVVVAYNTSGALELYGYNELPTIQFTGPTITAATPVSSSALGLYNVGNWNYVEIRADYNTVPHTVSVYLNNSLVIGPVASNSFSSDGAGAANTLNSVAIVRTTGTDWDSPSGASTYFDDLYLLNGAGTGNNDVLGPQRIAVYPVNGPGALAQWSVVGAPTNYEAVDDAEFDPADTNYVQSTALNQQDYYTLTPAEAGFTAVNAVQLSVFAKTTTGSGVVRVKGAQGGSEITGDVNVGSSAFTEAYVMLDSAPTGVPWTEALFNSTEIGIENL